MSDQIENEEPADAPPPPPATVPTVVVPRWIQLVVLPVGLLALYAAARASGVVLLLFITAAVTALILTPLVSGLQRTGVPRGIAIALVYVGLFGALAGAGALLANPISSQVSNLRDEVPSIVDSANQSLADVQEYFDRNGVDIQVKRQGETALQTLQDQVVGGTDRIVSFGTDLLRTIVTAGFGLVLIVVLSIYMLIHGERVGRLVRGAMPAGDGTADDDYPRRVVHAVAGYVRGQLLFSLLMGAGAGVGLWIFGLLGIFPDGKTYALAFGVFFGLMELIPYVGPFLGAAPPVLVALFQDPLTAVWVTLLFVGLQQVEGHIVAPVVFSHTLRINPLLVIFSLLFGFELYGIVGALVALPVAAIVRETVVHLRRHLVLEPWGTMSPLAVMTARGAPRPCRACGVPAGDGDRYCRGCGSTLQQAELRSGA
jgi:predicted PurR-regulated permease PerM